MQSCSSTLHCAALRRPGDFAEDVELILRASHDGLAVVRAAFWASPPGSFRASSVSGADFSSSPPLYLCSAWTSASTHGTSSGAVLPIATSGVVGFALEGRVDWPVAAGLSCGAMAGAVIGTHALHVLGQRALAMRSLPPRRQRAGATTRAATDSRGDRSTHDLRWRVKVWVAVAARYAISVLGEPPPGGGFRDPG